MLVLGPTVVGVEIGVELVVHVLEDGPDETAGVELPRGLELADGRGVEPALVDLHLSRVYVGLDVEVAPEAVPETGIEVDEVAGAGVGVVDLATAVEIEQGVAVPVGLAADVETGGG